MREKLVHPQGHLHSKWVYLFNEPVIIPRTCWLLRLNIIKRFISTTDDEKINKLKEIRAWLYLSQAWHFKGNPEKAATSFNSAVALARETGCWRELDRFEETRDVLGVDVKLRDV